MSREDRVEEPRYENLATLRLEKRQKTEGALGLVTALASMYLFSVSGVQGDPNGTLAVVRVGCFAALFLVMIIEMFALVFGSRGGGYLVAGTSEELGSEERLSLAGVEDEMILASLVCYLNIYDMGLASSCLLFRSHGLDVLRRSNGTHTSPAMKSESACPFPCNSRSETRLSVSKVSDNMALTSFVLK